MTGAGRDRTTARRKQYPERKFNKMILLLVIGYAAACYKWGGWKQWRDYYSTILYVIIGDLAYQFVFKDYRLWTYTGMLGHTYTALILMFLVFPPAILLFLAHVPSGLLKKTIYITAWAIVNTAVEWIACRTNGLHYAHSWGILWSFALFVIAFILIWVHYKRQLLVWPVSLACGVACAIIFKLPPLT